MGWGGKDRLDSNVAIISDAVGVDVEKMEDGGGNWARAWIPLRGMIMTAAEVRTEAKNTTIATETMTMSLRFLEDLQLISPG